MRATKSDREADEEVGPRVCVCVCVVLVFLRFARAFSQQVS